ESLIAAGPVVQPLRATPGAELVPVDSEHCAIHQCLRSSAHGDGPGNPEVARLVLTASGGPFRGRTADALAEVTVEQALAHPTWSMGPKITIDSATLMNKGLEVIEAGRLFGLSADRIEVVVHPQSIIHSMVEYVDGSIIAQLGQPDMRIPLAYALHAGAHVDLGLVPLDFAALGTLTFERPDLERFPALRLAFEALRAGGTMPAVLNAANEVGVRAFLDREAPFTAIAATAEKVMDGHEARSAGSVEEILEVDRWARARAASLIHTNPA
ncbi:MAG: 1-deoxy-D-xylulose-5-phosphate reductoisomerase, partial [Myxococcales bacterium]|nr:1-deoxy-D-xylulose-5-phosphate reductoisomerase [Myxococcales bacterium]